MTGVPAAAAVWIGGLRRRPARALLSVLGIAAGVALAFAVAAENASLTRGVSHIQRGLAGQASLEVSALGPRGIPQSLVARVRSVPGVAVAAPVSQQEVTLHTGHRTLDVRLFGADARARALGSELTDALPRDAGEESLGLYLTPRAARSLRAGVGSRVGVAYRGPPVPTLVARVLPRAGLGAFGEAPVAMAPLGLAQELTGTQGRIDRILIRPRGDQAGLRARLAAAAGPSAQVRSVEAEQREAAQASSLDRISSSLFAGISLIVGGLLAYSAIVLNAVDRRREMATLRVLGCGLGALFAGVLADALVLGGLGTALGLGAGRLALGWLLEPGNTRLGSAFLLTPQAVAPLAIVGLGILAGLVTSLAAAVLPAWALAQVPPAAAMQQEPDAATVTAGVSRAWLGGAAFVMLAGGFVLGLTGHAIVGVPLWVMGGLLTVPLVVPAAAAMAQRLLPVPGGPARVGVAEVSGFPARATAIAAVVTLTVCCLTIVEGAVSNLESGTARLAKATFNHADLFVKVPGGDNVFLTRPFDVSAQKRVERLPFVADAGPWRSTFLDWRDRRVLVFAFTSGGRRDFRDEELIRGHAGTASRALAAGGGAVALSDDLAQALGLHVGDRVTLPTPSGPRRVHVVATITNYGWVPGAITMSAGTFARWWGSGDLDAIEVRVKPGIAPAEAVRRTRAAVAPLGLTAAGSDELKRQAEATARADLANLRRIATMVAIAGLLAVTAATLAGVLQRIRRVAALRTIGMTLPQLALALFSESACVVGVGALTGLVVGVVGHALVVHHLEVTIAAPVGFELDVVSLAIALGVTVAIALASALLALRWAARAPLTASLGDA